jgi:hypothetical protein
MESTANRVLDCGEPKASVYLQGFPRDQAPYGSLYNREICNILR